MTRTEKWLVAIIIFLLLLLTAFVAEHIYLVHDFLSDPPQLLEPCATTHTKPTSKP